MEPIIEKKLDELLKLTEENNKMLLKMRKAQKWATVMRMVYWFIIIGLAAGSFYFIKPYFNNILNVYTGGIEGLDKMRDFGKKIPSDFSNLKSLLGTEGN